MQFQEELRRFRNALNKLAGTEEGKIVLDYLQKVYVDSSAMDKEVNLTFYRLGQKEFVQGLIQDSLTKLEG